nr:immunoglobulin light chain junction region [Macaca mulatta]
DYYCQSSDISLTVLF